MGDGFAFIIHPIDLRQDIARRYPGLASILPATVIELLARIWPPVYLSHIDGVRSNRTSAAIDGWLLACPLTAQQMVRLPLRTVYRKIVQTGRLAQELGAGILGLGAFTSVVGDGGVTISKRLNMPVTSGNSLTVAFVIEALEKAASRRGVPLTAASVAVIGATGSIGLACAKMLASMARDLLLIGRSEERLAQARERVEEHSAVDVHTTTSLQAIREADVVLSATSAMQPIVLPQHLKYGAIICDVALPPDVSPRVRREREDVLIIEGGVVDVPGEVDFGFDFGLPAGKTYACMAEAMVLAMEGRYENYSLGKHISVEQIYEIARLAHKHGFQVGD